MPDRRSAGLGDRDGLARGDCRHDEVGACGKVSMGRRQRDAMACGMVAQGGASLIAAQLDVVSGDLHVLLAQILGEDAADFAIADEADIPKSRIGRDGSHAECSPVAKGWVSEAILTLRLFATASTRLQRTLSRARSRRLSPPHWPRRP